MKDKSFRILLGIALCILFIVNCDLFNNPVDPYFLDKIKEEVAYHNAPWVPLQILNGDFGTSSPPQATHPQTVKFGYSFNLSFQPASGYPFSGFQAWFTGGEPIAIWRPGQDPEEAFGANKVKFVPINDTGTEVEIFVYVMPEEGRHLFIGPYGVHASELPVALDHGDLGVIFPARLSGVMRNYPFTISFQPHSDFPFTGWQAVYNDASIDGGQTVIKQWHIDSIDEGDIDDDGIIWSPRNITGTEMSITITAQPEGTVVIMPLGGDYKTVTVRIPMEEGRGSVSVPVNANLTRRYGFPFIVEFAPSAAWAFTGWQAFSDEYLLSPFSDSEVKIEQEGGEAKITVVQELSEGAIVYLVPVCLPRPVIEHTNPPLINSGTFYTRGQEITIWINLEYTENQTFSFGENQIEITGYHIANGQLYGDLADYFQDPVYNSLTQTISIKPKSYTSDPPGEPPPGNLSVTVTVGTGITAANGYSMASPVSFAYRTNNEIVTRAYKANNVWAIHNPQIDRRVESFFYQTAPSDRDRRLRKNDQGNYEVTLYFSVSRSMGEIEDEQPDALTIMQIPYADLAGNVYEEIPYDNPIRSIDYTPIQPNNEGSNEAGGIYRQMNAESNPLGVNYYTAVYVFSPKEDGSLPDGGIYRLVVLPSRTGKVLPDNYEEAVKENRFVTVVIDDKAPGGVPVLNLSGNTYIRTAKDENNIDIDLIAYTEEERFMTINPNFSRVQDNFGIGGILPVRSNPNIPWTMDEQRNIQWKWRIDGDIRSYESEDWYSFGTAPPSYNVSSVLSQADYTSASPGIGEIRIKFRDSLEFNESDWTEPLSRIIFTTEPPVMPITDWSVEYIEASNSIIINWTNPSTNTGVQVNITGALVQAPKRPGTGQRSYIISNVDKINTSFSNTGLTVNLKDYKIELVAYQTVGTVDTSDPSPPIVTIYNIPGMAISKANMVHEISSAADLADIRTPSSPLYGLGPDNSHKIYILKNDISISSHTPIGSGTTEANAFTGKFYGLGNTITVSGFSSTAGTTAQRGLFGTISGAEIGYLDVRYPTISISSTHLGGIAGLAMGSSEIISCNVQGSVASNTLTLSANGYIGGIIGLLSDSSKISNSRSAINLAVSTTTTNTTAAAAGGIAGAMVSAFSGAPRLEKVFAEGNVALSSCRSSGTDISGGNNAGGLVGLSFIESGTTPVVITQSYAAGSVTLSNTTSTSGTQNAAGGLVGRASGTNISECYATGTVVAEKVTNETTVLHIASGGLVGFLGWSSNNNGNQNASIANSYALGNVTANQAFMGEGAIYAGGLVGIMQITDSNSVNRNFAGGNVTSRIASNGNNRIAYAGGIAGSITRGRLENNIALGGSSIIAQATGSSSIISANRIYGFADVSAVASGNFANNGIRVRTSTSYTEVTATSPARYTVTGSTGANTEHGSRFIMGDAAGQSGTQGFWTSNGFSANEWDFAGLASLRYPTLRNAGDKQTAVLAEPANVTINVIMRDSGNNGWDHNGALRINVNGTDNSPNIRLASGGSSNVTENFTVRYGDLVDVYWTGASGSAHNESSFLMHHSGDTLSTTFNPTGWNGTNALLYRLYNTLSYRDLGQLLGNFTAGQIADYRHVPDLYVDNGNNSGNGSLRQAISDAPSVGTTRIIVSEGVGTISLDATLRFTEGKNIVIEGNGVTITKSASFTTTTSGTGTGTGHLVYLSEGTVAMRDMHFKDGNVTGYGAAIRNAGASVTLESCIFSGNRTTNTYGGAIYNGTGSMSIIGCTFYNNTNTSDTIASSYSCIYAYGGTVTLKGNLFYGNNARGNSILYRGVNVSASYNVVDIPYGIGAARAGWTTGTGDKTVMELGVVPLKPATYEPAAGLGDFLPASLSADFPHTDFNGAARTWPGAPGAVATAVSDTYSPVTVSVNGGSSAGFINLDNAFSMLSGTGNVMVTIDENQTLAGTTSANIAAGRHLSFVGTGAERQISLSSNGSMFIIANSNSSLTIGNNITLVGRSVGGNGNANNNNAVVQVSSGSFTMLAGSKITGNTSTASTESTVGAVNVRGANASFNMKGGTVSGNSFTYSTSQNLAGLYLANSASAHLEGGSISDAMVHFNAGSFTMSGAAKVVKLALNADASSAASITAAQNWTGTVDALNLRGQSTTTMTDAIGFWQNRQVIKAESGSLTTALVQNVTSGSFLTSETTGGNSQVINVDHEIASSGENMGRLIGTIPLTVNSWHNHTLAAVNKNEAEYSFNVTSGTTYRVWWNDNKNGNGTASGRTLDVKASASYHDGTEIFSGVDNGWFAPQSFTASQSGKVTVKVEPFSGGTGTYHICFTTGNNLRQAKNNTPTVPGFNTELSNHAWRPGNITSSDNEKWYYFSVTSGTTYRIWWDDAFSGLSGFIGMASAYYLDGNGTEIFASTYDGRDARSFTADRTGIVMVRVIPYSPGYNGNFRIVFSRSSSTKPSITHISGGTNSSLSSSSPAMSFTFNVTNGRTYRVRTNDSDGGGSYTADVVTSIYYPDGTVIFDRVDQNYTNNERSFTANQTATVLIVIEPYGSGTGTFYIYPY